MKDGFSFVLALSIVFAVIMMWQLGIDPVRLFRPTVVYVSPAPEPAARGKTKPAAKRPRAEVPGVVEQKPAPEQKSAMVAAEQIPAGMLKRTILETYGNPALSFRSEDDGHVLETLVYQRDRTGTVTVISLGDGRVSSARSQASFAMAASKPQGEGAEQAGVSSSNGMCGEYRDGKLTVQPCAKIPLSTSEWLEKGGETAAPGSRH